jgi:4-diphosphocytidyl-2-C-methyl-D-erythritol kinase
VLTVRCAAKINFILDVLGKRPDGYHELTMVMQSVSLYDTLSLQSQPHGITLVTSAGITEKPEDNLIYKAALLLQKDFPHITGVSITLDKKIPLAAGLAGGSADCAGTLHGLNRLFNLQLSTKQLEVYANQLGSDITFCLYGGTYLAEGRGELLTKLPGVPAMSGLILKPPFPISTAAVYRNIPKDYQGTKTDLTAYRNGTGTLVLSNDLYPFACQVAPEEKNYVDLVKKTNPLACQMSGSGPSIFAFYHTLAQRNTAELSLSDHEIYSIQTVSSGIEFVS